MGDLRLRSRQWVVDENDNIIIGEGRQEIFETIERTGSINQTAKIMKMSYKGVWGKIKATEKSLNMTIVDTDRKLGSKLTEEGKELLERYAVLKKKCLESDDKIFRSLFSREKGHADNPPVVLFVGWSGSGKTTLLEKIIGDLTKKGFKVGAVKHHHGDIELDREGKDSWRHKQAGAERTVISSPGRIGLVMDTDHDYSPEDILPFFPGMDIVLAEGFKRSDSLKVEIYRSVISNQPMFLDDKNLIALVSDRVMETPVPQYKTDDISGISQFLISRFKLKQ